MLPLPVLVCVVCVLQALLLHNQAIRDAAYTNAGHVLAQEGDSFIVGFADPLDAAVFALQVRTACAGMLHAMLSAMCTCPGHFHGQLTEVGRTRFHACWPCLTAAAGPAQPATVRHPT